MNLPESRARPGEWQEFRHDSGAVLGFRLLRSARRTVAIYVNRDGSVLVRSPQRMPFAEICHFLRERWDWLHHHRSRFLADPQPPTRMLGDGESLLHLGEQLVLRITSATRLRAERCGQELLLGIPEKLTGDDSPVVAVVEAWQRREARRIFPERLAHCHSSMQALSLPVPELRIRKMRSRWGSCSRSAVITLNLELVRMPLDCIDYVVTHELCHLVEFNHSPRFYDLQAKFLPDWKERKRRLEGLARQ
ncbi:MAG TPA: SprT family zinc-dependent metalloprotease [Moraxellaceae bacterium]|nr:SprT family zinc-dependent metalloprotease [Moraxellaceae bacterium]